MKEKKTYKQALDALEQQSQELRENSAVEANEKREFLLEMCKNFMITGEFSCENNDHRVEICTLLIEMAEHYKAYIDVEVAAQNEK